MNACAAGHSKPTTSAKEVLLLQVQLTEFFEGFELVNWGLLASNLPPAAVVSRHVNSENYWRPARAVPGPGRTATVDSVDSDES